jgi:hypothetical protein
VRLHKKTGGQSPPEHQRRGCGHRQLNKMSVTAPDEPAIKATGMRRTVPCLVRFKTQNQPDSNSVRPGAEAAPESFARSRRRYIGSVTLSSAARDRPRPSLRLAC